MDRLLAYGTTQGVMNEMDATCIRYDGGGRQKGRRACRAVDIAFHRPVRLSIFTSEPPSFFPLLSVRRKWSRGADA